MTIPNSNSARVDQGPEPLAVKLARGLARSGVRGKTRLLLTLARLAPALQAIPLKVHQTRTIFLDLRLPTAHGLLVNSSLEPEVEATFRRFVREGDFVIDVGAHLGYHTVLLSALVGQSGCVWAIEPNPALLPNLERTANRLGNVSVKATALSSASTSQTLFVPADASMASLANWTDGRHGLVKTVPCNTSTLDECLENTGASVPAFIKCDVEGAEIAVLKGAQHTLDRQDAPVVLFEANRTTYRAFSHTLVDAIETLESFGRAGYTVYRIGAAGDLVCARDSIREAHLMLVAVPKVRQPLSD